MNVLKKIVGFGMATMMALSMGVVAFAEDAPGYVTFFKSSATNNQGAISMTQNAIEGYDSKVQVGDNYVYTIDLQSFSMTYMGFTGTGYMTGIDLGSAADDAGITADVSDDYSTLLVTVPVDCVDEDGNSALYSAEVSSEITFMGSTMTMPSSVKLAITDSELTY